MRAQPSVLSEQLPPKSKSASISAGKRLPMSANITGTAPAPAALLESSAASQAVVVRHPTGLDDCWMVWHSFRQESRIDDQSMLTCFFQVHPVLSILPHMRKCIVQIAAV